MKPYQLVCDYIEKSGLINKAIIQYLIWEESADDKKKNSTYIVFRPNGGSVLDNELCNEYFVLIDVIAPKNRVQATDDLVTNIVDYIKNNFFDDDVGIIQIVGAIPTPITTDDGRIVFRLQVSVKNSDIQ